MKSRDKVGTQHVNKELVDTMKALIEVYKSAFGKNWESMFSATVRIEVD
jgi:hypothetical protein